MRETSLSFLLALPIAVLTVGACGGTSAGGKGTSGTASTGAGAPGGSGQAGGSGEGPQSDAGGSDVGLLGPWNLTADYPLAAKHCVGSAPNLYCADETCVSNSGYVYCVGGASRSTYFSQLSSGSLGSWTATTDYPVSAQAQECVVDANFIYCAGGRVDGGEGTADLYYAPLTATGIGTWASTTPFPNANVSRCVASAGYIYCLSDTAYYAPLSSSGVGAWTQTSGPPTNTRGCVAVGGYAYCFGGGNCPPSGPDSDCYSPSYYAPLSAAGIGPWKTTTALPTAVSANFASAGSYLYYLSIPVFAAQVSSDGIGPWETATNYPHSLYPSGCVSSDDYLYCANSAPNSSYSAQVGMPDPFRLHLANPGPFPRSEYLISAWQNGGGSSATSNGVFAGAPQFGENIDEAVVFNCADTAAKPSGCQTTVVSPENTSYNYDVTIWYPCAGATGTNTNCCFLPAVGYSTPFQAWCASTDSGSFIITKPIELH